MPGPIEGGVEGLGLVTNGLFRLGTRVTCGLVKLGSPNEILETARDIFYRGSDAVVKKLVWEVTKRTLKAIASDLGEAVDIWEGIFTPGNVNAGTLTFILDNKSDLVRFLVDLAEPAKLYAAADSTNGLPSADTHGEDNELDLTSAMNRHAIICQVQRLGKSLSWILTMGKRGVPLENLDMDTSLRSDFNADGSVIDMATLTASAPEGSQSNGEKWLFVNGVAGEFFWLKLYCEKLRNTFGREITGIFNRSDGILWDLIECAGERSPAGDQKTLIQRTKSSREAQDKLKTTLERELKLSSTFDKKKNNYIVMIAYSQGCLLLRLVLEDFVRSNVYSEAMNTRLRVFTFGNPSIDWRVIDDPLHKYVNHTEHFANARDFVAKLGVMRGYPSPEGVYKSPQSGYMNDQRSLTFVNDRQDWIGHLFGTQYSLKEEHYTDGSRSKLLACAGGKAMGE